MSSQNVSFHALKIIAENQTVCRGTTSISGPKKGNTLKVIYKILYKIITEGRTDGYIFRLRTTPPIHPYL